MSGTGGTFTASTGTVEYNGAAQNIANLSYNNLTISNAGTKTLAAALTIGTTGTLTINSGATLSTGNNAMTFQGNFVNNGTFNGGSSAITISGTAATQSIGSFSTTGLVSMTKTSGTATLTGNVNGGALTINGTNGTLNLGSGLTHTFSGTWTRTNGTLNGGSSTLRLGGTVSGTGGTFTASTGTVEYNGAAQTIANIVYNNLTLSGTGAKALNGATVNGLLSMEGTATTSGTVNYGASSSLRYNGSGAQTVGVEWPATFARPISVLNNNGVTLNASKTGYTGTLTNNGKLICGNYQLTGTVINNGTIVASRTDIMISGTLTNNSGSTIEYNAVLNIPASTSYKNLTLSAAGIYYLTGDVTGISTLTLSNAATYLHTNGYNLGYATFVGPGQIISGPIVTLASNNPAVAAANISQAAIKRPVYRFTLARTAAAGDANLTALTFTSSGTATASDIDRFQLWTNSADDLTTATKIGTDVTSGQGAGSHNFGSFSQALSVGATRYFWITADVKSAATTGRTVSIAALSTADLTISSGSKHGSSYAGGTQTITALTTTLATPNTVAAGNIAQGSVLNTIYRFTLLSSGENTLTGFAFRTTASSPTFVQADLTKFQLWSSNTNDFNTATQVGNDLTTMVADGSDNTITGVSLALATGVTRYFWLTVDVKANATTDHRLTVSALTTAGITVTGTTTGTTSAGGLQTVIAPVTTLASDNPAVAAANVLTGSSKNPIYKFRLTVVGSTTLTSLAFVASGTNLNTNVVKYQLWSSTSDDLATASHVGSDINTIPASENTVTFSSLTQALADEVTRYFWITANLSNTATAGNTITVAALTTSSFAVNLGTNAGSASAGAAQTIAGPTITLFSENPALPAATISISSLKNPVYKFTLTRDAATGTVNMTGLTFSTTGTYVATNLSNFQLWSAASDDFAAAAKVGTDLATGLGTGSHSFATFSLALTVSASRYFWITCDVAGTGSGNTLIVSAVTTANITLSAGTKAGVAYAGGTQTLGTVTSTLASANPAVPASDLAASQLKRALSRFSITSNGNVTLSAVSFSSAGDYVATDITKFQLWTGITDDLSAAGKLGTDISSSLGAGSHSFGSLALPLYPNVTQYFWITIDVSSTPSFDKTISIAALSTSNITLSSGSKTGSTSAGGAQTFCEDKQWLYAKGQKIGQLSNAGTGYQVKVTVHRSTGTDTAENVYVGTNCREDFGDVRFFEGETALSYWMESASYGSSATFWVKMDGNLSNGDLYLTMRCSNSSVTTTSDGSATFLFFDDFNRTDDSFGKWNKHKTLESGTISIPKGTNYSRMGGGTTSGTYGHTVLGSNKTYTGFSDGVIEFRYRVSTDGISEVGFRGTWGNPGSGYKGRSDARTGGTYGGQSFLQPPYYGWSHLSDTPDPNANQPVINTWYRGSIYAYGSSLKYFRNGTQYSSSSLGTISGPGEISLQNHYGLYSDYDWVAVRKYANAEPTRDNWLLAPVALDASAVCHNGFTAHWTTCTGATGYRLDVLEADGVTYVTGWQNVSVSLNVHRVEIIGIGTDYKYRIRAEYNNGTSPNSNVISQATTAVNEGISATTSIGGAAIEAYVPPVTGGPVITNNNVTIDPDGNSTDDFAIVLSYHPAGYDIWPNGRLLATISCSNNNALNGTYTIYYAGMVTPASAAYRWGGNWTAINPTYTNDHAVLTINGLSKGAKGSLEILFDDGSGTLPVELSSFTANISAHGNVLLQWVTQFETNVMGFRIYRNTEYDLATAIMLDALIEATNTSQTQVYVYEDKECFEDGTYYYWLENLDYDGGSAYHGPAMINVNTGQGQAPQVPVIPGINAAYPNPFNPDVIISYGVPKYGRVKIAVYNIKGQLVKDLINDNKESGTYKVSWNGKDSQGRTVPSGIYLLKMQAGNTFWTKKITLSK